MCGGSEINRNTTPVHNRDHKTQYTAPDLREMYGTFRETGRVPYSYYGQGAPTQKSELQAVQAAYPDAFRRLVESLTKRAF